MSQVAQPSGTGFSGGLYIKITDGTYVPVVDSNGNLIAPIVTTDLTLTGNTVIGDASTDTMVVNAASFLRGLFTFKQTVTAMTTSATVSTAAILGGIISANQGGGAAATYTLPTGTILAAALPASLAVGDSFDLAITNVSTVAAEDVTVVGDTGTTLKGSGVVNSNAAAATDISSGMFRFVKTGTNTFDVYRVA